jgi:hypothetical protein
MTSGSWQALRGAAQTAVQVVLVMLLFATLQFLAGRHNVRFDRTPTKRFSLSPYARQAAEAFAGEARLYAFYDSQQVVERRRMLDLLDQIHSYAPRLSYELVDLDRKPGLAKKFGVSHYNSGVLEMEDGTRYPIRAVTEDAITSTLLRLTRDDLGVICFMTGHGGRDPRDTDQRHGLSKLVQSLEREGFSLEWLVTLGRDGAHDACSVLVWVSATHDLVAGESDAIEQYVRKGGRALFLLDPGTPPSFDALLARFGLAGGQNVIVDESNRMLGADSFVPQVDRFRPEIFSDRLQAAVILPVARTIRATGENLEDTRVISLAGTNETSWAYMDSTEVPSQDAAFRPDLDQTGPLSIAARASVGGTDGSVAGQVIAVGDSDFVTNAHIDTLGNRDFILAIIGVLAEDPSLIGMRREDTGNPERPLTLSAAQTRTIFWVGVVLMPGISALAGVALAARRRRQRGGR